MQQPSDPESSATEFRKFAESTRRLLSLLAPLVCLALLSASPRAGVCPPGLNLFDTDGNGWADYACVGDWNNNGIYEMEADIQAAVQSLYDPGLKTILVDEYSFVPPLVAQGTHGIIVLSSNTTLLGAGPGTLLNGFVKTDVTSQQAVITNANHTIGNSNIVVRDLRIDGGWRDGDASELGHARMGVRFTGCTHCTAERLVITDTLHACLYSSNSSQIEFLDSKLERCGNVNGAGSQFPCVYLYAYGGGHTQDVLVRGIDCDGSGATAFTTRRNTTDSTLTDLVFQDNLARNTVFIFNGSRELCFTISGVGSAQYLNNTCIDTGGLGSLHTESWYSDGLEVNASANVTVDGLHVSSSSVSAPVFVRKHAENFTLRNITVNGVADGPCLSFETPLRNFSLDGADLSGCGEWGIQQHNLEASGDAEDETLTFRNIEIRSSGTDVPSEGLRFRGPVKGLLLDNVTVDDVPLHGVRFDRGVEDSTISNLTISDVGGHGIYLRGELRNVTLTQNEIDDAGSDCILLEGSPGPAVSVLQTAITESTVTNCAGRGIAIGNGDLSVQELQINDNTIDGVDDDGIEIVLGGSQNGYVEVEHNLLYDFGRAMGGGPHYGIELAGDLSGASVLQNSLDDRNDQATHGVCHDVPGSHPTYLCSNPCSGTLLPTECLHDGSDPAYQTDSDDDGTVDACEDGDGDEIYGPDDNCPDDYNPLQTDDDDDGLGEACDNCDDDHNPAQADFDSDSEGDLCDLNDGLIYALFQDDGSLHWQLEDGFERWNVYRGDLAVLTAGGDYSQQPGSNPLAEQTCGMSAPPLMDDDSPGPGQVAFYLISGVQGFNEGSLGNSSHGLPRLNAFPCAAGTLGH